MHRDKFRPEILTGSPVSGVVMGEENKLFSSFVGTELDHRSDAITTTPPSHRSFSLRWTQVHDPSGSRRASRSPYDRSDANRVIRKFPTTDRPTGDHDACAFHIRLVQNSIQIARQLVSGSQR